MSFFKGFLCFALPFFFLSILLSSAVFDMETKSDVWLLISFKNSLSDPTLLGNWNPDHNPCSFSGILCENNHVSAVNLSFIPLSINFSHVGTYLMTLRSLETLSLRSTSLSGSIFMDPEAKCGAILSSLDLSENSLSGPMSDMVNLVSCPSLKSLNLSGNLLTYPKKDTTWWNLKLQTIDISFNKISGPDVVPWIISGGCDDLTMLSLKGNAILEDVDISGCKKLEHFDISDNKLSRVVPSFSDCSALKFLDISANMFYGDIEKAVSGCVELKFLNITANQFSGLLPAFNLRNLQFLYLSRNHFQGGFSRRFIEACSSLVVLDCSWNNLSGTVPSELASCSSLESISLSGNHFTGELPIETLLKFSKLKDVALSKNSFFGMLPYSLTRITALENLDLSANIFSGSIPSWLCENPNNRLKTLYLQSNNFTGFIPPTLSNCSELVSLDLSFNYLKGTIPQTFGSLSKLNDLVLWFNQLDGEIPQELMYIRTLKNLILDFNQLTGPIPSGLSNCTNLNWLSLSNNRLSGEIPAGIGQLLDLAILTLSNNSFHGRIPPEIGNSRKLVWLDLNTNRLTGTIPPELFRLSGHIEVLPYHRKYVFLRNVGSKHCHGAGSLLDFEGIRKEVLERISAMNPCEFTRPYRGNIHPQFKHHGSMISLDLSYNMLSGSIPEEVGKPEYLSILYLSHNNLSGSIPDEMGNLKSLGLLDLSNNHLEGPIPQSMSAISTVVDVDFSNNHLWGRIPDSAQFNTFRPEKFANNSGLCGTPLPACLSSGSQSNQTRSKSHRMQASIVSSITVVSLFIILCLVGLVLFVRERGKRRKENEALAGYSHSGASFSRWKISNHREALSINLATFEKPLKKLTFGDLVEATNGFDRGSLIGSGGFGDVYRALLKDGTIVAVKKLIHISGQADREFTAEMETIGKIKHRNLVSLYGYCKLGEERLLVYEFMKNGSLDDVLHNRKKDGLELNWPARKKIARGAARGLAFLHHSCIPHIIHRDMKSSNVLLDDNLDARVSDFGMARLVSAMDTHLSVSTLAGTPGYVPPEYYQSFRCSTKGDVYSFGVVFLELLTGRQCTSAEDFGDNNLVGWVKQHGVSRARDVLDPVLVGKNPRLENELMEYLKMALACVNDRPSQRPTMIQVMTMFREMSNKDAASTSAALVDHAGEVEMAEMRTQELREICELAE